MEPLAELDYFRNLMKKLRIAVNTRLLLKGKMEGIGWFGYEILKRLTESHPEHEFLFFFDRPYDKMFVFSDNVRPLVLAPQARHPILYMIWFEWSVKRALKKWEADIFLSPDGMISLNTSVPSIPVIHDLNFEHHPEYLPLLSRIYYRYFFPRFARKAERVATVSEYSRQDISSTYDIPIESIDVIPNGLRDGFKELDEDEKQQVREKYTESRPYFVYIGALIDRKNIKGLFQAFSIFKRENPNSSEKLVIVGDAMWGGGYLQEAKRLLEYPMDVVFTGRLDQKSLNAILSAASALTYVPFFEGFGVPIIEAFAAGTPVITSNTTSMPEVAGDGAILIDPYDANSISLAMKKISTNEELRQDLIARGKEKLKMYNWQSSANKLWKSIEQVIGSGK